MDISLSHRKAHNSRLSALGVKMSEMRLGDVYSYSGDTLHTVAALRDRLQTKEVPIAFGECRYIYETSEMTSSAQEQKSYSMSAEAKIGFVHGGGTIEQTSISNRSQSSTQARLSVYVRLPQRAEELINPLSVVDKAPGGFLVTRVLRGALLRFNYTLKFKNAVDQSEFSRQLSANAGGGTGWFSGSGSSRNLSNVFRAGQSKKMTIELSIDDVTGRPIPSDLLARAKEDPAAIVDSWEELKKATTDSTGIIEVTVLPVGGNLRGEAARIDVRELWEEFERRLQRWTTEETAKRTRWIERAREQIALLEQPETGDSKQRVAKSVELLQAASNECTQKIKGVFRPELTTNKDLNDPSSVYLDHNKHGLSSRLRGEGKPDPSGMAYYELHSSFTVRERSPGTLAISGQTGRDRKPVIPDQAVPAGDYSALYRTVEDDGWQHVKFANVPKNVFFEVKNNHPAGQQSEMSLGLPADDKTFGGAYFYLSRNANDGNFTQARDVTFVIPVEIEMSLALLPK